MINAINISATALMAGSLKAAVIANNIANINTPSFKARAVSMKEQASGGVDIVGTAVSGQSGSLINTKYGYDFAATSRYEGYLQSNSNSSNRSFRVDPNTEYQYTPEDKANLTVDNKGTVYSAGERVGEMTSVEGNTKPDFTGEEIFQGYLVSSNVNIMQEMVDNIFNLNYFKLNTKAIQSSDEMMKSVINIVA